MTTHTYSCPLCGLRYRVRAELDLHARDDHPPAPRPEEVDAIVVTRPHWPHGILDDLGTGEQPAVGSAPGGGTPHGRTADGRRPRGVDAAGRERASWRSRTPEERAMLVELDEAQARAVRSVLEVRLGNLSSEIRHTDSPRVREELRQERETVRELLGKLDDVGRTTAAG